jgi:hypothetical protein
MNITIKMLSKDETPCEDGLEWFKKEPSHELCDLVKSAIKQGTEPMKYVGWGLCAVMTKEQRIEWAIFSARQVDHLWKDKYPKEYAIWNKWASGEDRSDAAGAAAGAAAGDAAWYAARAAGAAAGDAAGAAAWAAAWYAAGAATWDAVWYAARAAWDAAGDAARAATWDSANDKTLAKILRYGVKILMEGEK